MVEEPGKASYFSEEGQEVGYTGAIPDVCLRYAINTSEVYISYSSDKPEI